MKKYGNYQESGIEWIGEIPAEWSTRKIKWLSPVRRGASPRPIDDPKYFDEVGEFAWVRIADVTASDRYLLTTSQRLSDLGASLSVKRFPGDFFLSIAGSVGKPMIAKIKCCIHDGFVYFPKLTINPEYLYYIFQTGLPYQGLGKLGTQLNLNTDSVGSIEIPLPGEEEVESIVKYLDNKTSQIDTLISKKEKLIELLQEERTAIINQAVTKGLDPTVPMKDSGIEWLGEIPKHWKISALKHYWAVLDCKHITVPFFDEGLPVASIKEVQSFYINLSNAKRTSHDEYLKMIDGGRKPQVGDLIYSRNATVGEASYVNRELDFCLGQDVCLIRSKNQNQIFLSFLLKSNFMKSQLDVTMVGSTFKRVNVQEIKNFLVTVPSPEEQNEIASFLLKMNSELDLVIEKIRKEIDLLNEYKTALISETVTGKIDVRQEVLIES